MLFILPLVVAIAGVCHFYFGRNLPEGIATQGLIPSDVVACIRPEGKAYIICLFTLGIAYFLFFINAWYKFLAQQTTLPAVIYVLLTFGLIVQGTFSWILFFTFFIIKTQRRIVLLDRFHNFTNSNIHLLLNRSFRNR